MSRHDDRYGFVFTFPGLGRGADDVVVTPPRDTPPRDTPPREGLVRMHPSVASFLVRDWALARDTAADLDRLSREALGKPLAVQGAPTGLSRVLQPLLDAFEAERLVLWGPRHIGVAQPAVFPSLPGQPARIDPTAQTTWIEIVLLDQDGVPVADEPYTLVLPDGGRRSGQLDERGFARVDGIVAGVCDVSFPRIDGREWGPG